MPFQIVKVKEYESNRCGYKWTSGKNGVESLKIPRFCPWCKTSLWNTKRRYEMNFVPLIGPTEVEGIDTNAQ